MFDGMKNICKKRSVRAYYPRRRYSMLTFNTVESINKAMKNLGG